VYIEVWKRKKTTNPKLQSQIQTQKEDIAPFLDTFLREGGRKHPFYIGVTSDPYPDIEQALELTRHTLQELAKRPKIRVVLCTHGSMIERDIDVYKTMSNIEGIGISITTHDNEQIKTLEPGAPGFEERIAAAWKLYEAGLPVHVNITPWLPGISQADMIGRELPEKMKVNVGVLSYNRHLRDYTKYVFGRDIPSAERVFGKNYPEQRMINDAFIAEHKRVGKGSKGNLNWLVLPNSGKNHTQTLDHI
jgi:DNA repair photolyase